MKEILKHIVTICLLFISINLIGQSEALTVDHSLTDKSTAVNIEVEQEGNYEVLILSPNAEIQSRPIKMQAFKKGQLIEFNVNSKYWRSGSYRILVRNEEGRIVKTKQFIVNLSESQKMSINRPK